MRSVIGIQSSLSLEMVAQRSPKSMSSSPGASYLPWHLLHFLPFHPPWHLLQLAPYWSLLPVPQYNLISKNFGQFKWQQRAGTCFFFSISGRSVFEYLTATTCIIRGRVILIGIILIDTMAYVTFQITEFLL